MTVELFIKLALAVFSIIQVIVVAYLVPYLKAKYSDEQIKNTCDKFKDLYEFVLKAVEAANQKYTPEEWETKKRFVILAAQSFIKNVLQIEVTEMQLEAIIEGIVKEVKDSRGVK